MSEECRACGAELSTNEREDGVCFPCASGKRSPELAAIEKQKRNNVNKIYITKPRKQEKAAPDAGGGTGFYGYTILFATILFVGMVLIGIYTDSPDKPPLEQASNNNAPVEQNKNEAKADVCFLAANDAAKEYTNDLPMNSPSYKEAYTAAFKMCMSR